MLCKRLKGLFFSIARQNISSLHDWCCFWYFLDNGLQFLRFDRDEGILVLFIKMFVKILAAFIDIPLNSVFR